MGTKVRVLAALTLDGITYQPDQVIDLPAVVAKAFADLGQVDPHKDAVAYCVKELGREVIVHTAPVADEPAADAHDAPPAQ